MSLHEAAHALAGRVLVQSPIHEISIRPDPADGSLGHVHFHPPDPAAEPRKPLEDPEVVRRMLGTLDDATPERIHESYCVLELKALDFVIAYTPVIRLLADRMLQIEEVTGPPAERLVDEVLATEDAASAAKNYQFTD